MQAASARRWRPRRGFLLWSGIDRYLPPVFGQLHPRWKTPYVSILVQAGFSAIVLLLIQINQTVNGAYQILVDATTAIYFISLLYMYAAAIKLAYRKDRNAHPNAVLIPGGKRACGWRVRSDFWSCWRELRFPDSAGRSHEQMALRS